MTAAIIKTPGAARGTVVVENVSKRFDLQQRYRSANWRDALSGKTRRTRSGAPAPASGEFWALKDVSFRIEPGTALGIVGHNGSGKSTMLKLLTGIMKPTHGSIRVSGRVGALIEVGAGFHPDLTGRENVFLNGSILGLSRREIAGKFDRIVSFAGLEQFIDTPVKRYSSGMYMRLGFSIAAHTEPDVLLIDEVLAVGDQQFQNRCLQTLRQFVAGGGTAILVSHAMGSVASLCPQCVWLDHGRLRLFGPTDQAVDQYMSVVAEREEEEFKRAFPEEWAIRERERVEAEAEQERRREDAEHEAERRIEEARSRQEESRAAARAEQERRRADPSRSCITGIAVLDAEGAPRADFPVGEPLRIRLSYRLGRPLPNPVFCVEILRRDDNLLMFATNSYQHGLFLRDAPLEGHVNLEVSFLSLNEGNYRIRLHLFADCEDDDHHWRIAPEDRIESAYEFRVSAGRFAHGCAYLPVRWELDETNAAALQNASLCPQSS